MSAPAPPAAAPTPVPPPHQPRGRRVVYVVAGLAGAAVSLAVFLYYGGGAQRGALPGLPDPGVVTAWALPTARIGVHAGAIATIGLLLAAVVLSPHEQVSPQRSVLSAAGYRRVRAAGWAALAWCICCLAVLVYTLSDMLGQPAGTAFSLRSLTSFIGAVNVGQAFTGSAVLAAAVFVVCRVALRPLGATIALVLALVATLPPVFTGHAASAGDHQLAVSGMLLHAVPVTLWAGGLLALAVSGSRTSELDVAVRRFSPLAATCLVAVAGSGVVSALVRLSEPADLFTHRYGQMVQVKVVVLVGLAVVGWWQRRAAMPALRRGNRRVFARTAAVEMLLFGLAMGTAVALSRSPTPVPREPVQEDLATSMLGYQMPPELTPESLMSSFLPDPLFITAALVAAGLYIAGVLRLRRRGDRWPVARTAAFLAGCVVVLIATASGLAAYGPVLFSVHMVQHLLIGMIAPILLALGGPVTLALRALKRSADPAWPGPREWLMSALHLPVARLFTHPLFALVFYVASMYAMYLTGIYEIALRSHAAHLLMMAHLLFAGYLFFWVAIGVDAAPRRGRGTATGVAQGRHSPPLRLLMVLVSMILHAFLGIIIMQYDVLLAADWFNTLPRDWGPDPLDDQYVAGAIAWTFGEVPTLAVACAVVAQWIRADEREQRRLDRAADRAEAEGREDEALSAYNAMLAEFARQDPSRANRQ